MSWDNLLERFDLDETKKEVMEWHKHGYDVNEYYQELNESKQHYEYHLKQNQMSKGTSKIKSVQGAGTFENANGVDLGNGKRGFFKFEYIMEDGTVLTANHKQNTSLQQGETVDYEVKGTNNYGSWGKVSKHNPDSKFNSKGGDYTKGIEVGHAINNAVNLLCAGCDLEIPEDAVTTEQKIYHGAKRILLIAEQLKKEA